MPYHHIEQIHERKGEKVALMLTAENMVGLVIGFMPLYLLSSGFPFWLRVLVVALGATIGVIATLDIGGMTPITRLIWLARGFVRMQLRGARLTPEQLPGAISLRRQERVLRADGPIQIRQQPARQPHRRSAVGTLPSQTAITEDGRH